jgi:carboxymethylenebutenolidase
LICKGLVWCAAATLVLSAGAPALAQQGTKIHMHRDSGYAADGFLYEPSGIEPAGGVLLIHDARGITDLVRDEAQRLALAGCVVVAIDLYRGRAAGESQTPAQLASTLAADEVMHDLNAAIDFLRAQPNVAGRPLAIVGWGLGGDYATRLALAGAQVRGVAITVAKLPNSAELTHLKAALLANVAGPDEPQAAAAERQLHALGQKVDIKIYSRARGNFFDPQDVSDFRPADALDAQKRIDGFVEEELGGRGHANP